MRDQFFSILVFVTLALCLVPSGARTASAKDKVVGPPEVAWKNMTYAQKKTYMKAAVTPRMKSVFQGFDGKKFKRFDCETCHGKDASERKFKMPSPELPRYVDSDGSGHFYEEVTEALVGEPGYTVGCLLHLIVSFVFALCRLVRASSRCAVCLCSP